MRRLKLTERLMNAVNRAKAKAGPDTDEFQLLSAELGNDPLLRKAISVVLTDDTLPAGSLFKQVEIWCARSIATTQ